MGYEKIKKNWIPKKYVCPKKCVSDKICVPKKCVSQKICVQKNFGLEKYGSQKLFGHKKFWVQKNFAPKKLGVGSCCCCSSSSSCDIGKQKSTPTSSSSVEFQAGFEIDKVPNWIRKNLCSRKIFGQEIFFGLFKLLGPKKFNVPKICVPKQIYFQNIFGSKKF